MSKPVRRGRRRHLHRWMAPVAATATLLTLPAPALAQSDEPILCIDGLPGVIAFRDVAADSPHRDAIDCLSAYEITTGTGRTTFGPGDLLRRDQAATLMVRVAEQAQVSFPRSTDAFTDDDDSVHEDSIDTLASRELLVGKGDGTFEPSRAITRGQAATLAVRVIEEYLKRPLRTAPDAFADDDGSVHEPNIDKAVAAGLIEGNADGTFDAGATLRRDQGATFMIQTLEYIATDVAERTGQAR